MEIAEAIFPALDGMDDATALLILEMQKKDIEDLQSARKGKNREGELSDAEIAMAAYQEELSMRNTVLSDRCMSRSLAQAVLRDAPLLSNALAEEDRAARDRAMAHRLGGSNAPASSVGHSAADIALDDAFINRLAALYVCGQNAKTDSGDPSEEDDDQPGGESSRWAAVRPKTSTVVHGACVACDARQPAHNICGTPCGHSYCRECLLTLFELSTTDETLFPPRCCRQAIPLEIARPYLNRRVVREFERKSIEYHTPNRTYCFRPACSSFVPPANHTGDKARCDCGFETCTICKNAAHDGDCPEDAATQQMLEFAREQGWQRCYKCRRLVELDIGCNHMTCPCGAQFCYICGMRWKACPCDQWNEDRLVARAEQVVARNRPRGIIVPEVEVDRAVEHLRNRHNCEHQIWRYVAGSHRCEECYQTLPQYVFECRQCRILACNRCKRNRL